MEWRLPSLFGKKAVEKDVPRASDWVNDFSMSIPASWPVGWWQQGLNAPGGNAGTSIVHACVDSYAQTIASVPGYHYRYNPDTGTKTRITTSALSRALVRPNDYQTRSDFFLNMVKELLMHGNAYIVATRNDRGEIAQMHQLPSRTTQPYIEPESRSIFYAAGDNPLFESPSDLKALIPARDICHIRLHTPRNPLVGVSPITNAAYSIASNASISRHQNAFFENMSRPSGVLSTDMKLTKDQMKQLREAWNEQSRDINTGGIPILGNNIKWNPMSLSNQDSQIVEAFQMTVEDIARAFRVPLPLVNALENATYNNVEQLISHWLSGGLGFMVDHVENALDKFYKLPTSERVELDIDTLLRTDFMTRVDGYTKAIQNALMTPNEARSRFGGLPEVENGEKPIVQQQMVQLGWTENQAANEPAPPPTPEAPPVDEEAERGAAVYFLQKAMNE